MSSIDRKRPRDNPRMSQIVIHDGRVYLAGLVARGAPRAPVAEQTADILRQIDEMLAEAGTSKAKLLTAQIWLTDIREFAAMNGVWNSWIDPNGAPARACVEARLASPDYAVEIMVTAAV